MVVAKKDTKDSSAEVKALKAELEKTRKALAEALEQIEKLKEDGHEYVDLGLSVKWATCNVGASKPEDYGDYFAWGETSTKSSYTQSNSVTDGKKMGDIKGNSSYDAARANWGGNWRMPTEAEMQELMDKCTWTWTTQNGVNGYKVTGPNGNKIFLPATGGRAGSSLNYAGSGGYYWSSTPGESDGRYAYGPTFDSAVHRMVYGSRYYGRCIRPVSELEETRKALAEALEQIEKLKEKETGKPAAQPKEKTIKDGHEYVDLGLSVKWATCNVGATSPEEYGDYFAWGETSPKEEYTEENSLTYGKQMSDIAGNAQYDAARANWGGNWRMPTKTEMQELIDKCEWEWVKVNCVYGYKVIGPNGNSIFLPPTHNRDGSSLHYIGGSVHYWSSTPYESYANSAYCLSFSFNSDYHSMHNLFRLYGLCIRPVSELEETRKALAESLEQIEKLKEKETGKPAAQPKEKTIKDGHEYVDLGLSVKWATCNVGATSPEEYGDYFAWGETSPKDEYTENNCSTYGKQMSDIAGNAQCDAATANWGGNWRMPTKTEMQELIGKCTRKWTTQNGVKGYKVTGPNGNSIFLPAAGTRGGSSLYSAGIYGSYWSSSTREIYAYDAYNLGLSDYGLDIKYTDNRYYGLCIRPVSELEETQPKEKTIKDGHEYVDLGLSVKWATCNVGASKPEDYGNYYAWGETTTKSSYTRDNSKTYGKSMGDIAGNSSYDAATANWGGNWRLPTKAERRELKNKCAWTWTTHNGVKGYKVTGPNGNSIFLPAAGYRIGSSLRDAGSEGLYWSSSPYWINRYYAYFLHFYSGYLGMNRTARYFGRSVRPVVE